MTVKRGSMADTKNWWTEGFRKNTVTLLKPGLMSQFHNELDKLTDEQVQKIVALMNQNDWVLLFPEVCEMLAANYHDNLSEGGESLT